MVPAILPKVCPTPAGADRGGRKYCQLANINFVAIRSNAIEMFFKNMNDHINRNRQLAIADPEQAIFEGLVNITQEAATQMVLRSRFDVSKWRTAEGAEASCRRAGE